MPLSLVSARGGKTPAAEFAKRQKTVCHSRTFRSYVWRHVSISAVFLQKTLVHLAKETPVKATWEEKDYYHQAIGRKEEGDFLPAE